MTIKQMTRVEILSQFFVQKHTIRAISRQLHVDRSTVARVIEQSGMNKPGRLLRVNKIDPYRGFIEDSLKNYPEIKSSRLHQMLKDRGYTGSASHFRHQLVALRPQPRGEAYLRLEYLPGDQAQLDWGYFGKLQVNGGQRALMLFVMVLSHSRWCYAQFFPAADMEMFVHGHVGAFAAMGGVPRVLLYDNLKSAVLKRVGDAIEFNPQLLDMAEHYHFLPRAARPARGNEKGRVERTIGYIRTNFFVGREFETIDDLNAQLQRWLDEQANERSHPRQRESTVAEMFKLERPLLRPAPDNPYPSEVLHTVISGKTPYVRFDRNDYSIDAAHCRRTLSVLASLQRVRVFDGDKLVGEHLRCWGKGQQIDNPDHQEALRLYKRQGRANSLNHQLLTALPQAQQLLTQACAKGEPLGPMVNQMLEMLRRYGVQDMTEAIKQVLAIGAAHPNSVRVAVQKIRSKHDESVPLGVNLSEKARLHDASVRGHDLKRYDELFGRLEPINQDPEEGKTS